MTTRACVIWTPDGRCLGHPDADDPRIPQVCTKHYNELFAELVEAKARVRADQLLHERLATRPRWLGSHRQPAAPRLREGAHLDSADERVLALLRGAA